MKKMKKIFALLIAMVMVLGMSTMAFAAELPEGTAGADKTITITTPSGLADDDEVTYTVYRVFAATANGSAISYQSLDGNAPTGFVVDDANNVYLGTATDTATEAEGEIQIKVGGATKYIVPSTASELTAAQIEAIAGYTGKEEVGTVKITGASQSKTVTVPDYGYFYITTTTGTVVTINSTNKSASVTDKNSVPTIDKTITGADEDYGSYDEDGKNAVAQVGTDVTFTVTITVGKGAKNYKFHDTMSDGLEYNGDAAVTGIAATQYEILETPEDGDTITITFVDGIAEDTEITITYSATVTSAALADDPANNTATLDYGDGYTTSETGTEVYNAEFTVTKTDGEGEALAGAGFVIANEDGEYYTLTDDGIVWVEDIEDADEHVSVASTGLVPAFTGLGNGTYTLIEKTVPTGYNKAADSTFTIEDGDVTEGNLSQASTVVNNAGSTLPSTGGMGTTIFYIIGAILVVGAGVVLVTRRRMNVQ